jgi:hypothetical protein
MTTTYLFKAGYTKAGIAAAPSSAPVITITDGTNTLITAAATTSTPLTGEYRYSYSGADDLDLTGFFHTTDATVDQQDLYSTPVNYLSVNTPVISTAGVRVGMGNLIEELRGLTEAGTSDYTVGVTTYWDNGQLQDVLDKHRTDIVFEQLSPYPTQAAGGSLLYQDYRSSFGFYEATTGGTAIFYVQDGTGANVGTALWSADYRRGAVAFAADTAGTTYYLTGRSYDLNASAADVWRRKASHAASAFDFSTDNHSVTRSQVYAHALEMAEYYEGKSGDAVSVVQMFRGDMG